MFVNCLNMTENIVLFSPLNKPKLDYSQLKTVKTTLFPHDNVEMITGRLSSSFHDFGRESSLGILPDNVGRKSLSFLNNSQLGNLNTRAIDILPPDEDLIDGRESLGILELNEIFNRDDTNIPNILVTFNESCNECDILDTAFLQTSRHNFPSTSSHSSDVLSFNTASLEPSKIYTVSSSSEKYENISKLECRRTRSLIEYSKNESRIDLNSKANTENVHYNTFSETTNDADNEDDQFQDSVFIEGKYIAHKIADGSILNDSFNNEMGILDNVPPPLWNEFAEPEQIFDVENSPITKNCENNISIKNSSITEIPSITVSVENKNTLNTKELLQNLSSILNSTGRSDQQISEGQHLLSSLAELLGERSVTKNTNFEDSGHSSVNELNSDVSCGNYNTDLNDSHLRKKNLSNKSNQRLSLSLNSDSLNVKVTKSEIYKKPNISTVDLSKNKDLTNNSTKSDGISIKLRNKSRDSTSKKGPVKAVVPVSDMKKKEIQLQTPGNTNNSIKKPVQYKKTSTPLNKPRLIPVAASTPTLRQNGDVSSAIPKSVRDWQSPQHKSPAVLNNRRSLPSSNSFTNRPVEHKRSTSTSRTSSSQMYHKVKREHPKESKSTKVEGRARSNSLGSVQPMGLMSSMNRVRENLLNSPEYKKITQSVLRETNKAESKLILGDKKFDERKPSNLLLKFKKLGKENFTK